MEQNTPACCVCFETSISVDIHNLSCCKAMICDDCFRQLQNHSAGYKRCPLCRQGCKIITPAHYLINMLEKNLDKKPAYSETDYDEIVDSYASKQSNKKYADVKLVKNKNTHIGKNTMGEITYCPPENRNINKYSDFILGDKSAVGVFYNRIEKIIDGETYFKMEYVGKNWNDVIKYIDDNGTNRQYKFMKTFDYCVYDDRQNYYERKYGVNKWNNIYEKYKNMFEMDSDTETSESDSDDE
jgi:hypothetical protein